MQSDAESAKDRTEAQLLGVAKTAKRKHEEFDSRAARIEAQLHQQGLKIVDYRQSSEAKSRRQKGCLQGIALKFRSCCAE